MRPEILLNGNLELVGVDWSGTVSDDRRPVHEANMRLRERYKPERIPFDEWLVLAAPFFNAVSFHQGNSVQEEPAIINALFRRYFNEVIAEGLRPTAYPGAYEALSGVKNKGKKIVLLSAHVTENLIQEAEEYELRHFFDFVLGDVHDKREGLLYLCGEMNVSPEKALYFADMTHDVRAAHCAGLYAGVVTHGYHPREMFDEMPVAEQPHFTIGDLRELPAQFS